MDYRDDLDRSLSPKQAEFFKDSVVRDKSGRLLTMYHGSSYSFDTFDTSKIRAGETDAPYNGFWFSDDPNTLPAWTRLQSRYEVYLNLCNPAPMDVVRRVNKELHDELYDKGNPHGIWKWESRSSCDELRYRLMDLGYDGIIHDWPPHIDKEILEQTGQVDFRSVRGTHYVLKKEEDYLDLYYYDPRWEDHLGEYITGGYDDIDDYLSMQPRVIVVFEPHQIKAVTNRTPTMDPNFIENSPAHTRLDDRIADAAKRASDVSSDKYKTPAQELDI